jgi:hypothetical protein
MTSVPTVFVLGASTSQPYGFPLGPELRNLVIDPFRGLSARERIFARVSQRAPNLS